MMAADNDFTYWYFGRWFWSNIVTLSIMEQMTNDISSQCLHLLLIFCNTKENVPFAVSERNSKGTSGKF